MDVRDYLKFTANRRNLQITKVLLCLLMKLQSVTLLNDVLSKKRMFLQNDGINRKFMEKV